MKNNSIVIIVLIVVFTAGGFYGGIQYQKSQVNSGNSLNGRQQFQGGQRDQGRNGQFGGRVIGQIASLDSGSLTVKLQDGSSKIVILSSKTTYSKSTDGSVSDLKVGGPVAVFGSTNADGSVTAQNVQLNPQIGMRNR